MASETQINAVVDAVLFHFNNNADLWNSFLERVRLETEHAEIESELRKMEVGEDKQNVAYQAEKLAKLDELAAKQAEIDKLG